VWLTWCGNIAEAFYFVGLAMRSFLPQQLLLLGALCSTSLWAQQEGLPHTLAPHETQLMAPYQRSRAGAMDAITTPPDFAVRTMAEWEEVQSVVITWTDYTGILKQIVRHAKEECEVIIVCTDSNAVTAALQNNNFGGPIDDLSNITFLEEEYNSIWGRDYGAETAYRNEVDSLLLVDWIYNRPRPKDDVLPQALAELKGIPIYSTSAPPYDLVHTGGNFMSDGAGTAFSSELVLAENDAGGNFNTTVRDELGVDTIMQRFMGIQAGRYIKMPTLPYDLINHIDMHMKLLDEETLLLGEFPAGESDGPQIEENLDHVLGYNSVFGTPYRVLRIPMPPSNSGNFPPQSSYRTYTNSVFINGTLLVPTYREEYDTTALRILRDELPGYTVVGIDCDDGGQNIISASGALHCITKTVGVEDPLLIRHQRLVDTDNTADPYPVLAYVRHRSGIANATLWWAVDTAQGFAEVPMQSMGDNQWAAEIPAQSAGTRIYYYLHATANSGKQQVRPIVAPDGWWTFLVDGATGILPKEDGPIGAPFPVPAQREVYLPMHTAGTADATIDLLDATGRTLAMLGQGPWPTGVPLRLALPQIPPGAYVLRAKLEEGTWSRGLVVH
jgi:agmatine deiminase